MTSNIDTSNIYTSNLNTSDIYTSNIDTTNIYTSNIDTSNIYTSNIYTSNVDTSNIDTSNIVTSTRCLTCIERFNQDFEVVISRVNVPHVDGLGTFPAAVGFLLRCNKNNNIEYFEEHITDSNIVDNSNLNLIDYAWSNISDHIKEWSSNVIHEPSILGSVYRPLTDYLEFDRPNISLDLFNSSFEVTVKYFNIFPEVNPDSWMVHFTVFSKATKESKVFISRVMVDSFCDREDKKDVLDIAWNRIKDNIYNWSKTRIGIAAMSGKRYVPNKI